MDCHLNKKKSQNESISFYIELTVHHQNHNAIDALIGGFRLHLNELGSFETIVNVTRHTSISAIYLMTPCVQSMRPYSKTCCNIYEGSF